MGGQHQRRTASLPRWVSDGAERTNGYPGSGSLGLEVALNEVRSRHVAGIMSRERCPEMA
jgi:hypothetical protein